MGDCDGGVGDAEDGGHTPSFFNTDSERISGERVSGQAFNRKLDIVRDLMGQMQETVKNSDREKIADKIVQVAGIELSSGILVVALLDPPMLNLKTGTEMLRAETATRIIRNNPHLLKMPNDLDMIRQAAVHLVETGAPTSTCMKLAGLLGEIGGKGSVDLLARFLNGDESIGLQRYTAISESIEALGKIGHEDPAKAIDALRRARKNMPTDDVINKSIVAEEAITKSFSDSLHRTFGSSTEMRDRLKGAMKAQEGGLGPFGRWRVGKTIAYENIMDTRTMTRTAIERMSGKRLGAVLGAVNSIERTPERHAPPRPEITGRAELDARFTREHNGPAPDRRSKAQRI